MYSNINVNDALSALAKIAKQNTTPDKHASAIWFVVDEARAT
jgi:hypothetical protein